VLSRKTVDGGKGAADKTVQHVEELAHFVCGWRLGHSGSSPPMSAAQDGATGRPPWSNLGELTFMDVAGEQVKFGSVSWDSVLHQCSTGDR